MKINTENYHERGENWDTDAACAELMNGDPQTFDQYFYPDEHRDTAVMKMAKRICLACPVRLECLTDALLHDDDYGIKGGLTPRERNNLSKPSVSGAKLILVPSHIEGPDAS